MSRSSGERVWLSVRRRPAMVSPTIIDSQPTPKQRMSLRQRAMNSWRQITVIAVLAVAIIGGGTTLWHTIPGVYAACPGYRVAHGDTLNKIAARYHTTTAALASLNHIRDVNRIYIGQQLCVAQGVATASDPLEWSNHNQVHDLLIAAANRHGLPHELVLAIAWQESGWTQHVIAWDGGIGTMQLMPYTASYLNGAMHTQLNPYRLWDNIELGTSYLRMLWNTFPGNLQRIISAYNEGAHAVIVRGIFNWHYVYNVQYFMQRLG